MANADTQSDANDEQTDEQNEQTDEQTFAMGTFVLARTMTESQLNGTGGIITAYNPSTKEYTFYDSIRNCNVTLHVDHIVPPPTHCRRSLLCSRAYGHVGRCNKQRGTVVLDATAVATTSNGELLGVDGGTDTGPSSRPEPEPHADFEALKKNMTVLLKAEEWLIKNTRASEAELDECRKRKVDEYLQQRFPNGMNAELARNPHVALEFADIYKELNDKATLWVTDNYAKECGFADIKAAYKRSRKRLADTIKSIAADIDFLDKQMSKVPTTPRPHR